MIAILKYPAGNIRSVINAMERIGVTPVLTDDPEELRKASHVIIPGQGEAATTMAYLRQTGLDKVILSLTQPVLGICIGMQLFCEHSDEGNTECLGIFDDARVERFVPGEIKVPHMGWNSLHDMQGPLFNGINDGDYVYFVHSYHVKDSRYAIAKADYPTPFTCALQRDNFYAVQFHPEKSGGVGEQLLRNFVTAPPLTPPHGGEGKR